MYLYSQDEVITDSSIPNPLLINAGRDIAFLFGDPGIVPIVDRVTTVDDMVTYTEINTDRKLVTWAQYYALGATVVTAGTETADEVVQWQFPFDFPSESITPSESTGGYQNFFDDKTQSWHNKGIA